MPSLLEEFATEEKPPSLLEQFEAEEEPKPLLETFEAGEPLPSAPQQLPLSEAGRGSFLDDPRPEPEWLTARRSSPWREPSVLKQGARQVVDTVRAGIQKTPEGLASKLIRGEEYTEYELNRWQELGSEVIGLVASPSNYLMGGFAAKAGGAAFHTVKNKIVRVLSKKALAGATFFGGVTAARDIGEQALQTGGVDLAQTGVETAKSAALGAVVGPVGAIPKIGFPAAVGVLGGIGPSIAAGELTVPSVDSFANALAFLGVMNVGGRLARAFRAAASGAPLTRAQAEAMKDMSPEIRVEVVKAAANHVPRVVGLLTRESPKRAAELATKTQPSRRDVPELTKAKDRAELARLLKETQDAQRDRLRQGQEKDVQAQTAREEGQGQGEEVVRPILPTADEAQRQADVELEQQSEMAMGVVAPAEGAKPRSDVVDPAEYFPPEVGRRIQQARGVNRPGLIRKAKEIVGDAFRKATRAQEHIPVTGEFAKANEFFRLMKETQSTATDEATRSVAAIIDPLGPKQLELFADKSIIDNQTAALERGEPLRFGFKGADEVRASKEQIDATIAAMADPAVRQALDTRRKVVGELVQGLVDSGLLPESTLESVETYYHQQVLSFAELDRAYGGGRKGIKQARSFQKKRSKGESLEEEFDYNTSYIEAEVKWMAEAHAELSKQRLLKQFIAPDDIKPQLQEQAAKLGEGARWEDLVPETHDIWQPEPGNIFYRAFTIPQKIVEAVQAEGLKELKLSEDQLRTVLAMGGPRQQYVLSREVAAQLRDLVKAKPTGPWAQANQDAIRAWKVWTLLQPKRALAYTLRNLTGDLDALLAGNAAALREVPRAIRELSRYHGKNLSLSQDLRNARDLGVVTSSMTAQEIPDVKGLAIFRRMYSAKTPLASRPAKLIEAYFDRVKNYNEFRENTLRYAAYLSYLKSLRAGSLAHFGGAKPAVVRALQKESGNEVAAAHLARNMIGDYGNLTVLGDWMRRRLYPFWSWNEINFKRYPRLAMNAVEYARIKGKGRAWATGVYAGIGYMGIGAATGAMWAWNHLKYPDDEEKLGIYDRQNPHVTMGHNEDGTVRVFRNVGALGDFLEWFGINTLLSLRSQYINGQITGADIAREMIKDPANKLIGGLGPHIKAPFELTTGLSAFPDVFNPRSQPRDEMAVNMFGLRDEYRAAKGQLLRTGERARPHYMQTYLLGVNNPKRNAIHEMHDLRAKFLAKEGKPRPSFGGTSPFRIMREAGFNGDYEAFKEARRIYVRAGNTFQSFKKSLLHLDPIAAKLSPADERKFEQEFLNNLQREKLRVARDYAADTAVQLRLWWNKVANEEQAQ